MLCSSPSPRPRAEPELPLDDFMCDDIDSYLIAMETSDLAGPSYKPQPQPKPQTSSTNHKSRLPSEEDDEEEEPVERPPNKKVLKHCILKSCAYLISCYSSRFHSLILSSARFSLAPCCRLALS